MTSGGATSIGRQDATGSGTIAVAIGVMNVATYGFTVLAARVLGPVPYGALAGLMATLLVLSVIALGLQTTTARRIASSPEHAPEISRSMLSLSWRVALGLALLLVLATPVTRVLLRLDGWLPAALLGVAALPLTLIGGASGVLQGQRRWRPLAAVHIAVGGTRLVFGATAILLTPTETAAMLGVTFGLLSSAAVGEVLARRELAQGRHDRVGPPQVGLLRESARNASALLAFLALGSIDVVLARHRLDPDDAGLYAAGLILTKAVLFLPQFVVVLAFPSLSLAAERRRTLIRALALVAALGAAATAGALVLSSWALVFVGGADFAAVEDRLWLFALAGTVLAMVQVLVYSEVARQGRRQTTLVVLALVVLTGLALGTVSTLTGLILVVLAVDALLLAGLAWIAVRSHGGSSHGGTS